MGIFKRIFSPPLPFIGKWKNDEYTVFINTGKVEMYHNREGALSPGRLIKEEFVGGYHLIFNKGVELIYISFIPIKGSMTDFEEIVFGLRTNDELILNEELIRVNI